MASPIRSKRRSIARTVALAAVLGVASGYVIFYGIFPVSGVPASGEASVPWMLVLLGVTSILVGLATENLSEMIFEVFLGLLLGGAVATGMALSPLLVGVVFVSPDSVPAFLFHYGFLLFVLGFVVDLVGTSTGLALRERYFLRRGRPVSFRPERK
ncbi:MAG TPA: hypothetical protein VNP71_06465 [Thermoplasmata archaeon]|nr:hypothetical protein [Thermoplasmata archaeon]